MKICFLRQLIFLKAQNEKYISPLTSATDRPIYSQSGSSQQQQQCTGEQKGGQSCQLFHGINLQSFLTAWRRFLRYFKYIRRRPRHARAIRCKITPIHAGREKYFLPFWASLPKTAENRGREDLECIALPRGWDDLKCAPLRSAHIQRKNDFIFRVCRALRSAPNAFSREGS